MSSESVQPQELTPARQHGKLGVLLALFISFWLYSFFYAPMPGVNEPHYLSKAKFLWHAQWADGDLFLESSNPHFVFYATVGLLTKWLSLQQTAWIGRGLAVLLIALSWSKFIGQLVKDRWSSVAVAWLFLTLAAAGNFSGEWLVGGVESKVFAYAFVFWSFAYLGEQRMKPAAALMGAGISFHAVVGVWATVAVVLGFGLACLFRKVHWRQFLKAKEVSISIGLMVLCALPGLVPAIGLFGQSSAKASWQATFLQVYYRLGHHLDPKQFPWSAYALYAGILLLWLAFSRHETDAKHRAWSYVVWGSMIIGLGGFAMGAFPKPTQLYQYSMQMTALKFYPFRLFDLLLPLALSVSAIRYVEKLNASGALQTKQVITVWLVLAISFCGSLVSVSQRLHPSKMTAERRADWVDVCQWIEANTPEDSLFLTPPKESWAFKWYAGRAEYACQKDCPQDATAIVEWNRRLQYIGQWATENYAEGRFTTDGIVKLQAESKVTHVLARRLGPFDAKIIYRNRTFKVYELPKQR
ncbi:MAG: hypothetical protein CMJ78_17605 [Planctomycetaceae bacterium]|nr:hypothetical protein [Planctomycetaceae bacterium]